MSNGKPILKSIRGLLNVGDKNSKSDKGKRQQLLDLHNMAVDNVSLQSENNDLCLYPRAILQAASKGDLKLFRRLYEEDLSRLEIEDTKGLRPIHHATANGHLHIVEFIACHDGDLDVQTKSGDTSLHIAVQKENLEVLAFLLRCGANTTILNDRKCAPIHYAIELGSVKVLEKLLELDKKSIEIPSGCGEKPLHLCAIKNQDQCAQLLLDYGAKQCAADENGFFPVHLAATSASAQTLEVLIKNAEKLGYTRENIFMFMDKYNNSLLHSAVNGGNKEAVRVCLNAGASCDVIQEDKSTPLHLACAQGSLEMIRLMHEIQPEKFLLAANTTDVLNMTPLHRAAMFNHTEVMRFMLDQGADINCQDNQSRTPLLLAASKGGWSSVHLLLERGADIHLSDVQNRNFLHMAIKFGYRLNKLGVDSIKLKTLLNEKDEFGCTALHYASREGHLIAIDDLINLGATVNPKNNAKQSPLHFAARYGRYNTCKRLLDSHLGAHIINEIDEDGLSALHLSALNGHTKIINLLMQKGANITRDYEDNSPLHMAVINGYTKSIKLLLSVHPNLIDAKNKNGDTALHIAGKLGQTSVTDLLLTLGAKFELNKEDKTFLDLAIENKREDIAFAVVGHARWNEALHTCSPTYGAPMMRFIEHIPSVCMAVLDRCQTCHGDSKKTNYYMEYNFEYLQCPMLYVVKRKENGEEIEPMIALNKMVKHGRVDCISHPVCKQYLSMKWHAYGSWLHTLNLVQYAIYVALMTMLVTDDCLDTKTTIIPGNETNTTNSTINTLIKKEEDKKMGFMMAVWVMMFLTIFNVIKEFIQIGQQRIKYFTSMDNLLEWILYITTGVFVAPILMGDTTHIFQWEAGAVSIFLAWFNCLLFLQRFDFFGIYVVMFLEIMGTLLRVLLVFSILFIAFGLTFFILMKQEASKAYSTPQLSIARAAMMMLELDYMSSFNEPLTDHDPSTLPYGNLTYFFLILFVLLMPILLINLLIGLAVGDIEAVQKDATLKRLAMQVELHTDLERRLPRKLLQMVDKSKTRVYPNKSMQKIKSVWSKMMFVPGESSGKTECKREFEALEYELYKQKTRLKEISSNMEKQYDLLRLIVQKMEIHTEDDNRDEGIRAANSLDQQTDDSYWKSSLVNKNIMKPVEVINVWKKAKKNISDC